MSIRFTGSAGQAIISKSSAYLVTDSRYWIQARRQLDKNWNLIPAGDIDGPKDWIVWLVDRAKDSKIGIDARMLSHEKAVALNSQLVTKGSKLFYPPQNLVDLIWKDKPSRPREHIYVQPLRFTGVAASQKIGELREWIRTRPASVPSYSKRDAKDGEKQVATLISNLACIGKFAPCVSCAMQLTSCCSVVTEPSWRRHSIQPSLLFLPLRVYDAGHPFHRARQGHNRDRGVS